MKSIIEQYKETCKANGMTEEDSEKLLQEARDAMNFGLDERINLAKKMICGLIKDKK